MQKKVIFFIIMFIAAYCLLLATTPKASAQQEVFLGVNPPILQIDATAPTSIKSPITIQNLSNDPLDVSLEFKPFKAANSYKGEVTFLGSNDLFQGEDPHIFEKMQILDGDNSIDHLSLAPQQTKTLTLHIGIPKDEPPSDYYFSIVFISNGQLPDQNTASVITGGVATNVLLSIGPQGATKGDLLDFSAPLFLDHGPVNFSLLLQNTSKHFITPRGFIIIRNMFGQAVGKVVLLPVNVLAQSNRYVPDAVSQSLDKAVWPETFLLGPYSAKLSITLSEKGPVFERTIYFFAMPFQVLIGLVIIAIITAIVTIKVRQKLQAN